MACFPDSVSQHRRRRTHLRRNHGRDVRTGGFSVDSPRNDICRRRSRLCFRTDVAPRRRPLAARDYRSAAGHLGEEDYAAVLDSIADTCRCCLYQDTRRTARRHDGRQSMDMGRAHLRLLCSGDYASHRQTHRQDIPHIRRRTAVHGLRIVRISAVQRHRHTSRHIRRF